MDLIKLKEYIKDRLENLSELPVYDGKADENATFPYLCFHFPSSSFEFRNKKDRILEIDFWNDSNDDSGILAAAEKVKSGNGEVIGLDGSYQTESEGFYRANIEFEGEIQTQERNVSHFNQRYLLEVR